MALLLSAVVVIAILVDPVAIAGAMARLTNAIIFRFDRFFLWTATATLLAAIVLIVSPWGRLRLGKEDERPEFDTLSWLAMLFAAGMGSGLVFWGVAEPLAHARSQPLGPGAPSALAVTYFHWGLHAWAIYAISGLIVAWFGFRRGTAMTVSAPMGALFPNHPRTAGWLGQGAVLLAIFAVLFGVAGTLANGVSLLRTGLDSMGLPGGFHRVVQVALLALLSASFLASARSGLRQSIRWLSVANLALAMAILIGLAWQLSLIDVLSMMASGTLEYLRALPRLSFTMLEVNGSNDWSRGWTIIYLIWWIAWTPFVGVFIARISKGRTIRGFLVGVVVAPMAMTLLWFAVFGGGAISYDAVNDGVLHEALSVHYTRPLFTWLDSLSGSLVLQTACVILLFIFLVTSADSAAYVLGMLSANGDPEPSNRSKLAWGMLMVVIAGGLLVGDDVDVNKAVAIIGAIPFTVVLWLHLMALIRSLVDSPREGRAGQDGAH